MTMPLPLVLNNCGTVIIFLFALSGQSSASMAHPFSAYYIHMALNGLMCAKILTHDRRYTYVISDLQLLVRHFFNTGTFGLC